MSRPWGIHSIRDVYSPSVSTSHPTFGWVRAVAEPYDGNRLRAAWWVLTGRAFAFVWPKPGDVEAAVFPPRVGFNPRGPQATRWEA